MAAVLGTENYGHVSYLIALGSMGAAISMVGTSNTLIVYTAKKIPIESTLYSIALILGTIAAIVLYVFFENIVVSIFVFGYIFYNLGIAKNEKQSIELIEHDKNCRYLKEISRTKNRKIKESERKQRIDAINFQYIRTIRPKKS